MARFIFEIIKNGYDDGRELEKITSLSGIVFEEGDEVVTIPDSYEGKPVTHIGYTQCFIKGRGVFYHDWHHPAQGMDIEYDHYFPTPLSIAVSAHVKRIVLPKSMQNCANKFYSGPFEGDSFTLEIHPDNPYFSIENGEIVRK